MKSMSRSSKRVFLLILILLPLLMFFQNQRYLMSSAYNKLDIQQDSDRVQNLKWWLEKCYVEEEEVAGFGEYNALDLRKPNLYTTYGSVKILKALGQCVEEPEKIANWINSLQKENGSYDDPLNDAPLLWETYWAISTLNNVGFKPKQQEEITNFVLSLQKTDGLFCFDQKLPDNQENNINATHLVIEILATLDSDSIKGEFLRHSIKPLRDQLDLRSQEINESRVALPQEKNGLFLLTLNTFLSISPEIFIPENYVLAVNKVAKEVTSFDGDPFTVKTINWLINIRNEQNVPLVLDFEKLREITLRKVYSKLSKNGAYLFLGNIDPDLTNDVLELSKNLGLSYPMLEKLIDKIQNYRIEEGWISFTYTPMSISNTYYALYLAGKIGYEEFNDDKIQLYLRRTLNKESTPTDYKDKYFAFMALQLLDPNFEGILFEKLKTEIIRQASDFITEKTELEQCLYFLKLVQELNIELPPPVLEKMSQMFNLQRCERGEKRLAFTRMDILHFITIIQSVAKQEMIESTQDIKEQLNGLWSPIGAFRPIPALPDVPDVPDIYSTYLAIDIMQSLDAKNILLSQTQMQAVKEYILQSKEDFGFNYVSKEIREKYGEEANTIPTLQSTYMSYRILEDICY
ncbi:MAG: hypothetical protein A4E55_01040 [Pelotomaculum sp. PtaU1.Bin035]|nr:MAG: hypothetical protein A4E55_01040 [Pelotomaculum sp. PtaU1.Bin035]